MSTRRPTYTIQRARTLTLVIDPQRAFGDIVPIPHLEAALANMRRLLQTSRQQGVPTALTQHVFQSPGEVGRISDFLPNIYDVLQNGSLFVEFHPNICVLETDFVMEKSRFSILADENNWQLHELMSQHEIETVVVAGLTTPICVQTTVDDLMMRGYRVIVLDDACASQPIGPGDPASAAHRAHEAAIDRMAYLFAEVLTTDQFIDRLMET